jgi:zinc protease
VHKGTEPKANTLINFTGACVYNPENRFAMRALTELVQIKLNETLREQLGGTYSPGVDGGCGRVPGSSTRSRCNSARRRERRKLTKSVFAVIDTLKPRAHRRRTSTR